VALCLDLTLRAQGRSLDQALRAVWQRCSGGPMSEADFAQVLHEISGRDFGPELKAWVHGVADLPVQALLEKAGVRWHDDPAQPAQALGLRVTENGSIQIKAVLRGGLAEKAGMAAGDEWLGLEVEAKSGTQGWRLSKLDDLALYAGPAKRATALVARDRRLLRLPLKLPAKATTVRLAIEQAALVKAWLGGEPTPGPASHGAPASGSASEPVSGPVTTEAQAQVPQSPRKTGARLAKKASTPSK